MRYYYEKKQFSNIISYVKVCSGLKDLNHFKNLIKKIIFCSKFRQQNQIAKF